MTTEITNIAGVGSTTAAILSEHKFNTVASIANATVEALSAVPGFSAARAEKTIKTAKQLSGSVESGSGTEAGDPAEGAVAKAESKKAKKEKNKKKKDKLKAKDKKKNKKNKNKKKPGKKSKDKKKNKKRK